MTYWIRLEQAVALLRGLNPIWLAKDRRARIEQHPGHQALIEKLMDDLKRAFAVLGPPERFEPEVTNTPYVPLDQALYSALECGDQPVRALGEHFLQTWDLGRRIDLADRTVSPGGDLRFQVRYVLSGRVWDPDLVLRLGSNDPKGPGASFVRDLHSMLFLLPEKIRLVRSNKISRFEGVTEEDEIELFVRMLHHPTATRTTHKYLETDVPPDRAARILAAEPPPAPDPVPWVTDEELEGAAEQTDTAQLG